MFTESSYVVQLYTETKYDAYLVEVLEYGEHGDLRDIIKVNSNDFDRYRIF